MRSEDTDYNRRPSDRSYQSRSDYQRDEGGSWTGGHQDSGYGYQQRDERQYRERPYDQQVRFDANGVDINHPEGAYSDRRSDTRWREDDRASDRTERSWSRREDRMQYGNDSRSGESRSSEYRSESMSSSNPDAHILSFLHAIDQEEVDMGRLARDRGTSSDVREFGRTMAREHADHDQKVMNVARSANITLMSPDEVKRMHARKMAEKGMGSGEPKDCVAELQALSGTEFDKTFARKMVDGHREAIKRVEKARSEVSNSEVRSLLDSTLPTLRNHLEMAERLNSKD